MPCYFSKRIKEILRILQVKVPEETTNSKYLQMKVNESLQTNYLCFRVNNQTDRVSSLTSETPSNYPHPIVVNTEKYYCNFKRYHLTKQ